VRVVFVRGQCGTKADRGLGSGEGEQRIRSLRLPHARLASFAGPRARSVQDDTAWGDGEMWTMGRFRKRPRVLRLALRFGQGRSGGQFFFKKEGEGFVAFTPLAQRAQGWAPESEGEGPRRKMGGAGSRLEVCPDCQKSDCSRRLGCLSTAATCRARGCRVRRRSARIRRA
jgi:hypothetical protein